MSEKNLYNVLGCTPQSTTEQILAEYRARVLTAHPDKQKGQNEDFQLLQRAKDILSEPSKRRHYDAYLSIGSDMPLNEWMQNKERLQQTFHWAAPKESTPAISSSTQKSPVTNISIGDSQWQERHNSANINAFRNYEI